MFLACLSIVWHRGIAEKVTSHSSDQLLLARLSKETANVAKLCEDSNCGDGNGTEKSCAWYKAGW